MSKKRIAQSSDSVPPAVSANVANEWALPVSAREPCGPSLEYDHEYAVLAARMVPRVSAQYGDFVETPDTINWHEVERDCQRLLLRTRDINLFVWLCRARTRLAQAEGLSQALSALNATLQAWPEHVHPQLTVDGERDAAVRSNALAGLIDPEGLMVDVGDIAVVSSTALRLTVRDVERAFAIPRAAGALNPQSVTKQLADLHSAAQRDSQSPLSHLVGASGHVRSIEAWAKRHLGDDAPALTPLRRMLALFENPVSCAKVHEAEPPLVEFIPPLTQDMAKKHEAHDGEIGLAEGIAVSRSSSRNRNDVRSEIRASRIWFETHEPSSPVAVLLRQAERMVGRRFSQVVNSIPPDLLQRWEAEGDSQESVP
jgi:type VI secretion system protein ImpA